MDQTQDVQTAWSDQAGPGASCLAPADMRKARRFPMTSAIRIGWVDCERQMRYVGAQGVDISEGGLGVRLPIQLRTGALVNLELALCGISAVGRVRYCVLAGNEWRAGLEVANSFASDAAAAECIEA